ncbi:MAG: sodium-independent anion transporter [Clostridia bacterium]|nr:sodium-independent anion transporter [Clostridia bacterium]
MKVFQPKLFSTFKNYSGKKLLNDVIAGVIVAIIALPLSIALAIASGAQPVQGLYTAIFAGFVISFFGGSRVNISGPTAAFATIVAGIIATEGFDGLMIATIMAGIILILFGLLRVGTLIKYIPTTITVGFTAGIAVTIVIGQLKDFFGMSFGGASPVETIEKIEALLENLGTFNPVGFIVGAISLVILFIMPKIKLLKKIPASLVVVVLGALVVAVFKLNVLTIGDLYTIEAGFPKISIPPLSVDKIVSLIPDAFTIAILAAIESLLSCVVSDKMIDDKHNSNTELIAQGLGNIASGFFGGIPATGAIARTSANVKNGGRSPISGMVHAVVLLLVLLFLMPLAKFIPMPVIASVLLMVAYNMCEYKHFIKICTSAPFKEVLVLVVTFILTIIFDLVVAICVGLALALFFHIVKPPKTQKRNKI